MFKKMFAVCLLAEAWRYQVVGIRTYLSIRESADVNSREIARVPNGTILEPVFTGGRNPKNPFTNGFAMVYYRGMKCWAADRYLQQIDW